MNFISQGELFMLKKPVNGEESSKCSELPVLAHPCLYAGDFNCCHAEWGYNDYSLDGECLTGWASINCLALLYNAKKQYLLRPLEDWYQSGSNFR